MNPEIYEEMARIEDLHWWFRGRRAISRDVLSRVPLPERAAILDAGCGTGGNLEMLAHYGRVFALEMHDAARAHAEHRGVVPVAEGWLPENIPFPGQSFDLVTMFDVLEHIEDDAGSLRALHARLNAGGHLLLTVPAFPFLWSLHDEAHHHKRRYRMKPLKKLVEDAGFEVEFASHINYWLFPPIAIIRLTDRLLAKLGKKPGKASELTIPAPWLNDLLAGLFASETRFYRSIPLLFGVSIILLARKR